MGHAKVKEIPLFFVNLGRRRNDSHGNYVLQSFNFLFFLLDIGILLA
jgi:hypothetical protein